MPPASIRSNDIQPSQSRSLEETFGTEIFAGSGKLTAALRSLGLRDSFGVDMKLPDHLRSSTIKYNLLKPDHVKLVQDLIILSLHVHFAPPCGTSSRARLIQRRGRRNPPILRTDQHPDGLPSLTGTNKIRVKAANELHQVTCNLIEFCLLHKKYLSVENPGRSFMLITKLFVGLAKKFSFFEVFFHHCRYGSARRKLTKFLHNIPAFQNLELLCDNEHKHEPWGQVLQAIGEHQKRPHIPGIYVGLSTLIAAPNQPKMVQMFPTSLCTPGSVASDHESDHRYPTPKRSTPYGS